MAYYTFPYSPLPAGMTRQPDWGGQEQNYDSGESQGVTPYVRPLWRYNIPIKLMTDSVQASIQSFWNVHKGKFVPFLMKDPYDYRVNCAVVFAAAAGLGVNSNFYIRDLNSFVIKCDTTTIGSLAIVNGTTNSPYALLGTHFAYSQDTGVGTVLVKHVNDTWVVKSSQYFRKMKFDSDYVENAVLWGLFSVPNMGMRELP